MNEVIENLKGPIDWNKMRQYSLFEYIALVVTISGITVSIGLAVNTLWRSIKKRRR